MFCVYTKNYSSGFATRNPTKTSHLDKWGIFLAVSFNKSVFYKDKLGYPDGAMSSIFEALSYQLSSKALGLWGTNSTKSYTK